LILSIDFETRSACDLINEGVYNYASDLSTAVVCMAYSIDGAEPELWLPGDPVPACFREATAIYAWNATFERLIWDYVMVNDHDAPAIDFHTWRCSAFMARCNNLPNKLENAARCLNVAQQKDKRGKELIKLLSLPLADGTFCEDPELLEEFYQYCLQDVRTEQAVVAQLREPTELEWRDYYVGERINDRGVKVDVELCRAAQEYAAEEEASLIERISELTDGTVDKARGENLKKWVLARLTPEQEKLTVKYRKGERKISLDKWNRGRLLDCDDLDPDTREVVECSDFAQKSSVGKLKRLQAMSDPVDLRLRGAFMVNGASESGRYSSKGAQVHNFPREVMKDPLEVREDLMDQIMAEDMVDYYGAPLMTILSRMLRSALIPAHDSVFLVSDWSAIEGRVAPWLCDNEMGEAKLDIYRDDGPVYELAAAATFRCDVDKVTKDQRQIGKVQELSFQYQGGKGAFQAMARNYGVKATESQADRYKEAWRRANPWGPAIWSDIERAARLAIQKPGTMYKAGRLQYFAVKDILAGGTTLFCQLPCGRVLTYPDARISMDERGGYKISVLRAAFVPKADEKDWPRTDVYGGKLFNNAVQGTSASLLREALRNAHDRGLSIVLHVHDELVNESQRGQEDADSAILHEVMNTAPAWAEGLPLKADVEVMERFGK